MREKERNENRSTIKEGGGGGGGGGITRARLFYPSRVRILSGKKEPLLRVALSLVENHSEDRSRHSSLIPAIIALDLQRGRCAGH
jgi:hypothetical protein